MELVDTHQLKPFLHVQSIFGVCTSRHLSCIPFHTENIAQLSDADDYKDHPFIVDVPLGCNIVRWNIKNRKKLKSFRAHTDLITCVVKHKKSSESNETRICTTSHGGEIALWDADWNILGRTKVSTQKLLHVTISYDGTRIATTSLFKGGKIFVTEVNGNSEMKLISEISNGTHPFIEFTPSGNIIGVKEHESKQFVDVFLYKVDGTILKNIQLPGKYATGIAINRKGLVAIARGRLVSILDLETLDEVWNVSTPGSGYIKALIFREDELLCPSDNGKMTFWKREKLVKELKVPSGPVYFMGLSKDMKRIWMTNESGLHYLAYEDDLDKIDYELSFHGMTCCGVDTFEDLAVAGDFAGNVMIWKSHENEPFRVYNIGDSVRTVCWKRDGSLILIGGMSGQIYEWKFGEENSVPTPIIQLKGGVTCIKWSSQDGSRFAASTTQGDLAIIERSSDGEKYSSIFSFTAHPPISGPQDLNFGSIQKFAEIWSVSWSPDDQFIATSSEDQTTRIWNLKGELLQTLTGHTAAVTSVDWKTTSIGLVLASCADDRTVRLYNGTNFDLLHIFETTEVEEWHTITYLSMDHERLAVATQSGYIFVWSLDTKEKLYGEKMHAGSIEGLKWNTKTGLLVSCASDCTVSMFSLKQSKL